MTDLLEAAKAVIDRWDTPLWKDVPATGEYIARLRAAVERAETTIRETDAYEHGYIAGQKAMQRHERERIKAIIQYEFGELVSDLSDVMEMIDA